MIILDTNVISELMRPEPAPQVARYFRHLDPKDCFLTAITAAELRSGCAMLPRGKRRDDLAQRIEIMLAGPFSDRVLPFDSDASRSYAVVATGWRESGRSISHFDALIASIALSREATLVTRNVRDFGHCNLPLINPWEEGLPG